MKKEDGKIATNDKENMRFMYPHFIKVFNNHQPTEFSKLGIIKQRKIKWHIDDLITWYEFNRAINCLNTLKVSVFNSVFTES